MKELLKKKNVVLVGKGKKVTKGINTGRDAIVVGVVEKLPIETLSTEAIIPKKIRGMETDVLEVGEIRALNVDRKAKHRPAFGGISIGHYQVTAGTLGMVVKKNGTRYILSNNHVLANENNAKVGDSIWQPGAYDGGTAQDEIGELADFIPVSFEGDEPEPPPSECPIGNFIIDLLNLLFQVFGRRTRFRAVVPIINKVDAALARPLKEEDVSDCILDVGEPNGIIEPEIGMKVKKSGRTTGLNHDEIAIIETTAKVQYNSGTAIFEDQVVTAGAMVAGGDSGSIVLTEDNKVVGLVFAGSNTYGIFNRFSNVITELGLDYENGD